MERSIQGTKEYFERFSKETNFHRDTLEKAYRLEQLLKEINRHPELREGLVLKGGTAINFLYFKYPRLSVDLDFNFITGIGKEEKDKESFKIDEALRTIFKFERKLLPLLRKGEQLKVGNMIQIVRTFLEEMFNFTSEELEYINRFFKGDFKPEILFDKLLDSSIDLERHPMVIWKQRHLKDWIVRQKDK
jgi:predicted nucleotidyltransferase component of viral defense system